MRVLAHIHTFNDADIIDRTLDAVQTQTRPPDAVLLVDNASTDGTLDRVFPERVTVIRNPENLGTSGAVQIGFNHALERAFDWIWILDADSVPEPDALERLLELYTSWPQDLRNETGLIACLPRDEPDGRPRHGRIFTRHGRILLTPPPMPRYYQCHITIWSGSLYRLAAVRQIGLPNADYVLDRGELEYAYRVMKAGYKAFIHQDAVIRHNIRGTPIPKGLKVGPKRLRVGPISLEFYQSPPIRCYYVCRNTLYFTLYDLAEGRFAMLRELWRVRSRPGRSLMSGIAWQTALFTLNFAVRPRTQGAQIRACLRGIWHGVTGNITARY
jgi:rhamnopyranosyl-N-acetylglucosaminyl-diphospho-decaprenol beta-1,3/1,4-galactofuranosyltransferase